MFDNKNENVYKKEAQWRQSDWNNQETNIPQDSCKIDTIKYVENRNTYLCNYRKATHSSTCLIGSGMSIFKLNRMYYMMSKYLHIIQSGTMFV